MKKKEPKHQPTANPEYAKAMQELRRSGASGSHNDRRTRRARTRAASLQNHLKQERN